LTVNIFHLIINVKYTSLVVYWVKSCNVQGIEAGDNWQQV